MKPIDDKPDLFNSAHTSNATFDFTPEQLSELIASRDLDAFYALGGLDRLEKGLRTDRSTGLSIDESILSDNPTVVDPSSAPTHHHESFKDRRKAFGSNHLPVKRQATIWKLMWLAYNDHVLFFLTGAAVVSLALGLYQAYGTAHSNGTPRVEWVEGVSILVAIVVIVIVGAVNDYQKQMQFQRLNKKKLDRNVTVIRSGRSQEVPIYDLVVGDVVHIEPGEVIPADGILIQGYHVSCDEAAATGESDLLQKHPGSDVFEAIRQQGDRQNLDPFILSGSSVAEGVGSFLVVATGTNSSYGRILLTLNDEPGFTPLQTRLNTLAKYIANFGGLAALILFVILFIKFLAGLPHSTQTPTEKGQRFLDIFIISLTVVVIAVPEGLPLTVTLALAFATTRMLKDNNLVRVLRACETMGNATDICSDKTGTLTQNKMTVVAGIIGVNTKFSDSRHATDEGSALTEVPNIGDCTGRLAIDSRSLLRQSIAINSTAFECDDAGTKTFVGSKTESALLIFARDFLAMGQVDVERSNSKIVEMLPFDNARQCMITVVQLQNGKFRAYVKGAPETLLGKFTSIIDDPMKGNSSIPINQYTIRHLRQIITQYAEQSLRTIILAFRDFDAWPLSNDDGHIPGLEIYDILQDLTFLSIMGIRDPLRGGARDAVQACHRAGVAVRIVTGDNLLTAKAIAKECGVLSDQNDVAMEGREFRQLDAAQQTHIIPHLKVLARSSPEDKRTLVQRLKDMGKTVAVTGDGTNDAPALAAADVGFSMGISGTEIAREASSIVLMDDNFSSIVKAIMWGRAVTDAVKKFLQFQITITFTSVGLAFVSSVASSSESSVLTAVQLMWVNLFQDTLAALALATDRPSRRILDRKPELRSSPLITIPMWKMIIGQSIYQLVVTIVLHFAGSSIFSYTTPEDKDGLQTAVFNTYVWMQIFNMYNNRQLENTINLLEGVSRNYLFICVSLLMMGCQILIIFVGGRVFSVVRLTGVQWAYSLVLGALSILVGFVIRLIPDEPFEWMFGLLQAAWRGFTPMFKIFKRRRPNNDA
ncbi:hypothetical protein BDV25DRAFT_165223 [Aspergillus avenaceus]|uniref:Calcium-transporting ATPase n=1 Tax=Aspergillus avenaceus TaxID=36643 RepID=A0A5N6TGH0_ASPAV|nr:hypothetical protein BDV25DRAFT_165223 [Aspergillus avenaceus]